MLAREKQKLRNQRAKEKQEKLDAKNVTNEVKALVANMPKRNGNSFSLFIKEKFEQKASETGYGSTEVTKALAKEWSSLPDSQKQKYRQLAEDAKKQFQDNFGKWTKTLSEDERVLLHSKGRKYLTKPQRSSLVPLSPYQAFTKDAWASVSLDKKIDVKEQFSKVAKEIAEKWKALSESERKAYQSAQ